KDVDATAAELKAAGVEIAVIVELHGRRNIFINDLAGNVVELSE
ncbi:MAG: VOC family protein, partial [Clostridiales bacterium]|nr:VOC family protein [Clostridiales bacterium]